MTYTIEIDTIELEEAIEYINENHPEATASDGGTAMGGIPLVEIKGTEEVLKAVMMGDFWCYAEDEALAVIHNEVF